MLTFRCNEDRFAVIKQLPQPPTNLNFCNKQCTLQTARVDLANEILATFGK